MADRFVTERIAFAVYQKRLRLGTLLSDIENWKEAEEAIKYFEDREAKRDYIWENKRKRWEYLYPLYLNLTGGYEEEKKKSIKEQESD